MKKLILILSLLLALSGCGQKTSPVVPDVPPTAPETAAPETAAPETTAPAVPAEDRNPTAAELGREEKKDLVFMVEGTEEAVPATLYIGQGYSIYIPDEGWRLEKDVDDGIPEDTWESTVNHDVELRVLHLGEKTLEQAQEWVTAEEDDYRLIEDKQGGLGGTDEEDREVMEVRFYPSGSQMYAVLYEYPMEAAEGFGARLSQITETFEVMQ
ncbi:lipoprotein [Oscillibacter sp.]|uniref:lipoprotein n=1 Tax=Oscillibacter sp. TaxID=1945593 RepID=UPI001B4AD195|nr:lipoprotein [Oscillibacter sp.]MBP3508627.1 hypothetical protein [Oscillibacter sp.]